MNIIEKILPTSCYNTKRALYPNGIVIHAISARNIDPNKPYDIDLIYKIFVDYKVSAHYLVDRTGDIYSLVPDDLPAYHAGKSKMRARSFLNNHSVGIEFVGKDDEPFEDIQYQVGAELVADICKRYGIDSNSIKMHSEVSGHKVRKDPKWDPGLYFDWIKFGALTMAYQGEKDHG